MNAVKIFVLTIRKFILRSFKLLPLWCGSELPSGLSCSKAGSGEIHLREIYFECQDVYFCILVGSEYNYKNAHVPWAVREVRAINLSQSALVLPRALLQI
jgi:hypothetical protein